MYIALHDLRWKLFNQVFAAYDSISMRQVGSQQPNARITHKARNEKSREKINRSQYISHCSITYEAKARSVNLRQSEISPQNPAGAVFSEKFARDFSALTNQRVCCCVCCVAVKSTWLIHVAFGLFFIHCTICPVVLWLSG